MKTDNYKGDNLILKLICFLVIIMTLAFFLIPQFIDTDNFLIGGPKYLIIDDNFISLPVNKKFTTMDLFFKEALVIARKHHFYKQEGNSKIEINPSKYKVTSTTNNKVIKIWISEVYYATLYIDIYFQGFTKGGFPKRKYIKHIDVDGKEVSLTKFYDTYIDKNESNVTYFKSFGLRNISAYLAEQYGSWLYIADILILISLFTIQFLLLFVTIIESFFSQKAIRIADDAIFPMNYVDSIAKDFSVVLGFFGSVVSIWTALEISGFDYSNFFQVFGMVKIAVFTTVLGLSVRITFGIREFVYHKLSAQQEK